MGFFEDRKRAKRLREASVLNWTMVVNMMTLGHETMLAEAAGVPESEVTNLISGVRDTIMEKIGEENLERAFFDAYVSRTLAVDGKGGDASG